MTTIHSRERIVVSRADTSAPTHIKSKHRGFTYSYTHMKLVALYSTSSTYAHMIPHMISLYAELAGVDGTTVTSCVGGISILGACILHMQAGPAYACIPYLTHNKLM